MQKQGKRIHILRLSIPQSLENQGKLRQLVDKREFVDLITPICKDIRKMLITNNTAFRKDFS